MITMPDLRKIFAVYTVSELMLITGLSRYHLRKLREISHESLNYNQDFKADVNFKYLLINSTPRMMKMSTSIEFLAYINNIPMSAIPYRENNHYQQYIRSRKFKKPFNIKAKRENLLFLENLGLHIHSKEIKGKTPFLITAYNNVQMLKTAPLSVEQVEQIVTTKDPRSYLLSISEHLRHQFEITPVATANDLMFADAPCLEDPPFPTEMDIYYLKKGVVIC